MVRAAVDLPPPRACGVVVSRFEGEFSLAEPTSRSGAQFYPTEQAHAGESEAFAGGT